MHGDLVALDLETTGLDIQQDHIIEVGAVRMRDGVIIDEFASMVKPPIPIPATITHITGIQNQDVADAPPIEVVLPKIAAFVGSSPVITHNATLDMGMLQDRHHILLENSSIDTYDLASVLVPRAPRYTLSSLTAYFEISLEQAHRALDDARATALLYWELWQKLITLPRPTVEQILTLSEGIDWGSVVVFHQVLPHTTPQGAILRPESDAPVAMRQQQDAKPLKPEISHYIGENGAFQATLPGFKHRPQQEQMAQAIADAFKNGDHLMVEAGTGTGKSMGYLLPAILWAKEHGERVIIATNTINLQDQLISQDIPMLSAALGVEFSAGVMKGRANYLSPGRLQAALRRRATTLIEVLTLAKILVWQLETDSGDRGEINLGRPGEQTVWTMVSADDGAPATNCLNDAVETPFCKARRKAEESDLIIVNHALLVADARSSNRVLPEYRYLIIDEAHQLEDAITYGMSQRLDQEAIARSLLFLGNSRRGLLYDVMVTVKKYAKEKDYLRLEAFISSIHDVVKDMNTQIQNLYRRLARFLDDVRGNRNDFLTLLRIDASHRDRTSFAEVGTVWQKLAEYFEVMIDALNRLHQFLGKLGTHDDVTAQTMDIITIKSNLEDNRNTLHHFIARPQANEIYWLGIQQGQSTPSVNCAPLHIGNLMQTHIWQEKQSVILTGATLRTNDEFEFLQGRLNAEDVKTLNVGSPFDYYNSTLVYVPKDVPEPNDRKGYQQAIEKCIIELAAALDGRVMVLFTSYNQLKQTAQAIIPRLALGNITVYDQTDGTSRQALLDGFKADERAVLLGTKSFWQGVDIPGDDLSALVITRLPFAVPSDPVFSSRAETYPSSFSDYNLPDAILTFRQGFGRLIRRDTDRGIVVILDSRIHSKSYGSLFLSSLPDCRTELGTLDNLPTTAQKWLKMDS